MHIPAADRGINVESQQQVLKDVWLGEKAVPLTAYSTQSEIQLHNIYKLILSVSVVCSCKEGKTSLLYEKLHILDQEEKDWPCVFGRVLQPEVIPAVQTAVVSFCK